MLELFLVEPLYPSEVLTFDDGNSLGTRSSDGENEFLRGRHSEP